MITDVGASKFLGGAKNFCPNVPKPAQNIVVQLLLTVFWCDLQKMAFTCFSANVGRHFSKSNIGRHFCLDLKRFCPSFQIFCSIFQGICLDFQ